jgi:carbonic anhydrase/acetyltransferase-like protein (isoleucine patch superfamily)
MRSDGLGLALDRGIRKQPNRGTRRPRLLWCCKTETKTWAASNGQNQRHFVWFCRETQGADRASRQAAEHRSDRLRRSHGSDLRRRDRRPAHAHLLRRVIEAHGAPVRIGAQCIVRENLNIRSTHRNAVEIGNHVLIGPHASLKGCVVEDECFLATGVRVYQGARIGRRSEVRIDGVVHVRSVLPPESLVPIKWVAVGDPARLLPPHKHEEIDAVLGGMNFSKEVYGLERRSGGGVDMDMKEVTRHETDGLADHRNDREL